MTVLSFLTISGSVEGLYKEKGSKFHAFAFPVQVEADVKLHLDRLKKKYFDASHHCFAYVLGADKSRFRAFDDGEPGHSAGDPILGQIRSRNLTNTLVVVVRYFGGTKLGVGGLINAYKLAAEDVLKNALILNVDVTEKIVLTYSYSSTPEVMKAVKEFELKILSNEFREACHIEVEVKISKVEKFRERVELLRALGHPIQMD